VTGTVQLTGVARLAAIRNEFPALARIHRGHPVAYFDGPGGTQVPRPVAEAVTDYLYHHNANTHWRYPTSEETDTLIAAARGGETVAFALEIACNDPFGFGETGGGARGPYGSRSPFVLDACELAVHFFSSSQSAPTSTRSRHALRNPIRQPRVTA